MAPNTISQKEKIVIPLKINPNHHNKPDQNEKIIIQIPKRNYVQKGGIGTLINLYGG